METETRDISKLADLMDPPGFRDLSKFHVTDLIHAVENFGKEVAPFNYDGLPQATKNIMSMGRIWEHLVLGDWIREGVKAGSVPVPKVTLEVDDVIGSLDGALYAPGLHADGTLGAADVVVEIKARFSPPNDDFPIGNRRYMRQCRAYCYMSGARKVWMPILYLSTKPPNTQYLIHRFEFTDLEVEENWQMLMNMKEYLEKSKS